MEPDNTPLLAQWDVTTGCNFGCTFCLSSSGDAGCNELDTAQAHQIVDRLHEGGVIFLRILGGEPFYRRDMVEIMEHAAEVGMLLSFSTNGSVITPAKARRLHAIRKSINYMQVSLYGTSAEAYANQTLNPCGLQLVRRGVMNMCSAGLQPTVFWVMTTLNAPQLPRAYELVREWGLPSLRVSPKLNIGRGSDTFDDSINNPAAWRDVLPRLRELHKLVERHGTPTVELHARPLLGDYLHKRTGLPFFFITCKAATTMVYVNAKGLCTPCPFECFIPKAWRAKVLNDSLGISLLDQPLDEIWLSQAFVQYRTMTAPDVNPQQMNTRCQHYRSGMCDPCLFTPCTCPSTIATMRDDTEQPGMLSMR